MGTKKLEIDIEGMSCASCQVNIQKSLSKVKGVRVFVSKKCELN